MKILCVIDSLGSGGAQRQLVEIGKQIKSRGHFVTFLVYHEENFFKSELVDLEIPVVIISDKYYLSRLLKMRKYIRNGNFDGVISFLEAASFICEIAGLPTRKWKLIVGERSANPKILKSIKRRAFRWFHFFADFVISNSIENCRIVKKINPFLPSKKCRVLYNIVDADKWKPAKDYVPLKEGKFKLVIAARHEYLKNAAGLIKAVSLLSREEKSELEIHWYGGERSDNSLQNSNQLIKKLNLNGIFTFHPDTTDILSKLQYADGVGLFSFYEGLPNSICEAMMVGKVIISSAVSDIPRILNNDKRFLVNPHDHEDISKKISCLLTFSPSELLGFGNANRSNAQVLFNSEKIVTEYLGCLEN